MLHAWMITAESDTKVAVCNVDIGMDDKGLKDQLGTDRQDV